MGPDVRPISRGVGCGMGWGGPESASFKLVYLSGSSCKKKISHKSCENKCFQTEKARDKASYPLESDWSHFHNLSTQLSPSPRAGRLEGQSAAEAAVPPRHIFHSPGSPRCPACGWHRRASRSAGTRRRWPRCCHRNPLRRQSCEEGQSQIKLI